MDERAIGIILRVRPLTETSLIVQWLTSEVGRIATVAKGARRSKSPLTGKLDLFFLAEFSFQRSRRSDLHTLREVSLRETASPLRRDLQWVRQASYAAQLIEQTTESETPLPDIFQLLLEFLQFLPTLPPQPWAIFAFELKLLQELGLGSEPSAPPLSAGGLQLARTLLRSPWSGLTPLRMTTPQIRELTGFLHGQLLEHLGKVLPARAATLGHD